MEYILNINSIKENNIVIKKPIKNQNSNYLHYYKLLYSNENFTLKYIIFNLNIENYNIVNEHNCYKLIINKNDVFFKSLKKLESLILNTCNKRIKKNVVLNCYNDLSLKEYIYMFTNYPNLKFLYLKISGIWEDEKNIGIVYKMYYNISTEKLSNIIC